VAVCSACCKQRLQSPPSCAHTQTRTPSRQPHGHRCRRSVQLLRPPPHMCARWWPHTHRHATPSTRYPSLSLSEQWQPRTERVPHACAAASAAQAHRVPRRCRLSHVPAATPAGGAAPYDLAASGIEEPSAPARAAELRYSLASCTRRTFSCSATTSCPNASSVSCSSTATSCMPQIWVCDHWACTGATGMHRRALQARRARLCSRSASLIVSANHRGLNTGLRQRMKRQGVAQRWRQHTWIAC
jgi:hypothetical protein